jgi:hypothetical protein
MPRLLHFGTRGAVVDKGIVLDAINSESGSTEDESMKKDDGMVRHKFAPGEEPAVYTADGCAELGHECCMGIETTIEGYEVKTVFCICLCHQVIKGDPT